MKIAAFFILLCACICVVHNIPVNGNNERATHVLGHERATRLLGIAIIVKKSSFRTIKNVTFTFAPVNYWQKSNKIHKFLYLLFSPYNVQPQSYQRIYGIKIYDLKSHPSNATIVNGGIGLSNVTFRILSQKGHGINSMFLFYTFGIASDQIPITILK